MNIGFRKSLFGFHTGDVMQYLEKTHAAFSKQKAEWEAAEQDLSAKVAQLTATCGELTAANEDLQAQLNAYHEKYEEIERLSKNIGKLYLVAQNSAKTVLQNSTENSELMRTEVEKNLEAVAETQRALEEVRREMQETNARFCKQVDVLMQGLADAKTGIADNNAQSDTLLSQLETLVQVDNA